MSQAQDWPRYAVFGYDKYYPSGGWEDMLSRHADLADAIVAAEAAQDTPRPELHSPEGWEYVRVIDLMTSEVVYSRDLY